MRSLAAATVSEYALCPRRVHARGIAPSHLETNALGAIVRRALQRAADARMKKEAYEVSYVVHDLCREFGVNGDVALFERARQVTLAGLRTLFALTPVSAGMDYETVIAEVRVCGTVDLIARRPGGAPLVLAVRTGDIPDASYAIALALAKSAAVTADPGASYAVLDLDERNALVRELVLPERAALERTVRDAADRGSEEPRPGTYCSSCDFLAGCAAGRSVTP